VDRLKAYRFPVQTKKATLRYFRTMGPLAGGELGEAMTRFAEDPTDSAAVEVLWNEPSEVAVTRTTCIPTMLRGGHAENALPQSATLTVNCRIFPGVEAIHPGTPVIPYLAPYGADGLQIRRAGIPTYGVMGLFMRESDRFEHGLNERVPVRAFFDALEFWNTVVRELAGGTGR
jgi:acetylornithine deacetylase/succinyl-diaminopimelate desuccinylase-like protein